MIRHRSRKIHMIGIGGAGMSPIAELLHHFGYLITGSDRQRSEASIRLETLGIPVQYNHTPAHVTNADLVVFSSAVNEDNEERRYARENGITQVRRAEMLGDLMRAQPTVCISGTHGKTTTTSLIGTLLDDAGMQPTVLVGGMLRDRKTHALIGNGRLMVAEADEYDRSFLAMYPTFAVVTNIDTDHLDCYRDYNDIKETFTAFVRKVPFFGEIIACADDPGVQAILPHVMTANITTYAVDAQADYQAENIAAAGTATSFDVIEKGETLGSVTLTIPGMHNVANALASIAVARLLGVAFEDIRKTFAVFSGVHRRFEVIGKVKGVTVVDDYAHHPREIRATIEGARRSGAGRVFAVFQPHLYTRTRDFASEFVNELNNADIVYITEIYKAREEPIEGVSAKMLVSGLRERNHEDVHFIEEYTTIPEVLQNRVTDGDYVLFLGAGSIGECAYRLVEVLHG
jgi:UDP-N-acetylmuramate--alanine ligase